MTVREAVRAQREAMKNRTLKENISYLWDYYGVRTICILIALVILISFIVSTATQKETALCGVFFGASAQPEADDYLHGFADAFGLDTNRWNLTVQTSPEVDLNARITEETYNYMQRFSAMVSAQMVDVFAADQGLYLYYSYAGYTVDLRTVFSPEELTLLAPHLYYIDGYLLHLLETDENPDLRVDQYPDPTKPEDMKDPIPVAVSLQTASEDFLNSYRFLSDETVIGICVNSAYPDHASAFLRYVLDLSSEDRQQSES